MDHDEQPGAGQADKEEAPGKLAHLRGGLILFHLLAILALAFPVIVDERGMDRGKWEHPTAQAELAGAQEALKRVGIDMPADELTDRLWSICDGINRFHSTIKGPFGWYYRATGIKQNWRMFPAPILDTSRLIIDVERDGQWQTVYRLGGDDNNWRAGQLEHDRLRAAMNLYRWELHPESHARLAEWFAQRAAEDFPEATRLRWRWRRLKILAPDEVDGSAYAPDGEVVYEQVIELGPLRQKLNKRGQSPITVRTENRDCPYLAGGRP